MEIDSPAAVLVKVSYQCLQLILGWLETKSSQRDFKFLRLDRTRTASIEQIKCLLDLLLLSLTELLLVRVLLLLDLFLALSVGTAILLLLRVLLPLLGRLSTFLNETVGLPFYLFEI